MDYSHLQAEAGASPWGSSSPRADRTTFQQPPNDSPTSTFQAEAHAQPQSPYTSAAVGPQGQRFPEVSTDVAGSAGEISPDDDVRSPDLSEQLQSAQLGDPDYVGEYPPRGYHSKQPAVAASRPGQTRYQSNARPQRQIPQYKLQAKITALERTGRKDPILRFDVHVCAKSLQALLITELPSDQFA